MTRFAIILALSFGAGQTVSAAPPVDPEPTAEPQAEAPPALPAICTQKVLTAAQKTCVAGATTAEAQTACCTGES